MLKKILFFQTIMMIIIFSLTIIKIDQTNKETIITQSIKKISIPYKEIREKPIGQLNIQKINLSKNLYQINSNKNNIEENVTIISESFYPSKIVLAAHSGEGNIAFFNNLDQLEINDIVKLEYYNEKRTYKVQDIRYVEKTGFIRIPKDDNNTLILTTCDKNNYHKQLIISCIEKEL